MNNCLTAILIGLVAGLIDIILMALIPMIIFSLILSAGIGIAGAKFVG
jgi:hypothetical protein